MKTNNITYFNKKLATDNEKMIETAALIKLRSWPSKMHEVFFSRSQLREFWVLALSVMLKVFKFEKSERTNIALALISHWFNVLIIYQVAINFISANAAVIVSLIYLTSSWTYQVALYLGHVIFSQTWALISILFLIYHFKYISIFYLSLSTFCIAVSFFSSSASRKYPYLWVILLILFDQFFETYQYFDYTQKFKIEYLVKSAALIFVWKYIKKIVNSKNQDSKLYQVVFPKIFGLNMWNRPDAVKFMINVLMLSFILLSILLNAILNNDFQKVKNILVILLWITICAIYILGPNVFKGLNRYIVYLNIGNWANHFKIYTKNSNSIFGMQIKDDFRGGGLKWFLRFQNQVSPVIFYFYIVSILVSAILCLSNYSFEKLIHLLFMILISVIPASVHNFTRGIQVGKAYYSQILGYFIYILFMIYNLKQYEIQDNIILGALVFVLILNSGHLLLYALPDLISTRSSCGVLKKFLISQSISSYSTYNSIYNDTLVEILVSDKELAHVQVNRYKSIIDSSDNFFVVPNRSSKSVAMESTKVAAQGLDFNSDYFLEYLEKNSLLEQVTVLKFPTIGTSKNYISESEVTGFRYFQIRDYSNSDFAQTYARVIDVNRAKKFQV